jgi:beta-fructofuranosidase
MSTHDHDHHRPRYHLSPDNWMNDPIPFFWDGEHHIFFQHNPGAPVWGDMHWGHASTCDGIRWQMHPIALAPTPGGPDEKGVWTGCVIEHQGTFYAFYTGINPEGRQVQCLAVSSDLIHWEKSSRNPIIHQQPHGFGDCFRDPHVWKEGEEWLMLIGSELPEKRGGAGLLYRSNDLHHWEYSHVLATGKTEETQYDWECPDFFPLGGKHILLSSRKHTFWHSGEYSQQRFVAEKFGVLDGNPHSNIAYAAKTSYDDQGQRILWAWLRESRCREDQIAAGWASALSLPRKLSLLSDGTLGQQPMPQLKLLRGEHHRFENLGVEDTRVLDGVQGAALEIEVHFAPHTKARQLGVRVMCDAYGNGGVDFLYDRPLSTFGESPLVLRDGEELTLRIWIDHSIAEAFANDRTVWTQRHYPASGTNLSVALIAQDGVASADADVWRLQ